MWWIVLICIGIVYSLIREVIKTSMVDMYPLCKIDPHTGKVDWY